VDAVRFDVYSQVTSEPANRDEPAAPGICHRGRTGSGEDRLSVVASEERRRQVPHITVHESLCVEAMRDVRAAFDEELQDVTTAELVEHRAEVAAQFERRLHAGALRGMAEHHS